MEFICIKLARMAQLFLACARKEIFNPLSIESCLHIKGWKTKFPKIGQDYALEFDIKYACVKGVCFNISELTNYRWNPNQDS